KLGEFYRARGMGNDYVRAARHFAATLNMVPGHIGAAIGFAEVSCSLHYWDTGGIDENIRREYVMQAARFLDSVDSRAAHYWKLHAVGGFLLLVSGNTEGTKKAFDRALALDRARTEDYPPYYYFLLGSGNRAEAVRLARKHRDANIDAIQAHT